MNRRILSSLLVVKSVIRSYDRDMTNLNMLADSTPLVVQKNDTPSWAYPYFRHNFCDNFCGDGVVAEGLAVLAPLVGRAHEVLVLHIQEVLSIPTGSRNMICHFEMSEKKCWRIC
jgi:hypothetical protein